MPRIRKNTKSGFVVMSNDAFQDCNLSNKARGLLATMMTLPPGWKFSLAGLAAICKKDGLDAIRTQVTELETAGYLVRGRTRNDNGRLDSAVYDIFDAPWWDMPKDRLPAGFIRPSLEKPTLENPMLENPILEKPTLENPMQFNKQISNKHNINSILSINLDRNDRTGVEEFVKDNIDFEFLCTQEPSERIQEIVNIIVDIISTSKEQIKINDEYIPYEAVVRRLLKVDADHVLYALDCLDNRSGEISNLKSYLITLLYNTNYTMFNHYSSLYERNKREND